MSAVMDLEAAIVRSAVPKGRSSQLRRLCGIEDYLAIGGSQMTARQVADRLGVTERTVCRYRAVLREYRQQLRRAA